MSTAFINAVSPCSSRTSALLAIEARGVLLEYEEIDLPLEDADNLKLAEIELTEGRQAEAKAALHLAVDELRRYEQLVGENRSVEVRALHAEITKLTAALGEDQLTEAQRKQAAESISRWWQRTTRWFKGAVK